MGADSEEEEKQSKWGGFLLGRIRGYFTNRRLSGLDQRARPVLAKLASSPTGTHSELESYVYPSGATPSVRGVGPSGARVHDKCGVCVHVIKNAPTREKRTVSTSARWFGEDICWPFPVSDLFFFHRRQNQWLMG